MQGNEIGKLVAGIVPNVTGKDIDEEGYESLEDVYGEEIQL